MSINKKIKNATQNTYDGIQFKSRLEALIYKTLKEQEFDPKYEPWKFTIWEGYKPKVPFFDRDSKTGLLKNNNKKIIDITYTPDFCFEYNDIFVIIEAKGMENDVFIIIEAKGMENDVFYIKKKLFRKYLESWCRPVLYFELHSKKQLLQAIDIIKSYEHH